jgi:hypothetical protein
MMRAMAQTKRSLYDIVGVAPGAPPEEVLRACEARASELEARGVDAGALALVRHAREVLTDPARRAAYDERIARDAAAAAASANAAPAEAPVPEDATEKRRIPWGIVGVVGAAVLIVMLFVARMMTNPVPPAPPPPPKPAPAPPAVPPSASQVLLAIAHSVVKLQAVDLSGTVTPLGLAVSTEAGLAVTTCHAIPANAQIVATTATEKGAATLVLTDEMLDLCKLSISGLELKTLASATTEAKPGTKVYVVSPEAPGGFALADAAITQVVKGANGDAFQISTSAANGAPVLDEWGKLLGVATKGQVLPVAWIADAKTRSRQSAPASAN